MSLNIFEIIEIKSKEIFFSINPNYSIDYERKTLALIRIVFCSYMLVRYIYAIPFAGLLMPNFKVLAYLFSYLFMMLGFLSPLANLAVIILEIISPLNIEVPINVLVPLSLFFLNANDNYSFDNLFGFRKYYDHFFQEIKLCEVRIYFLLIYSFICLSALFLHAKDEVWQSLDVNKIILTSTFISIYPMSKEFASNNVVALKILLVIQIFWEFTSPFIVFFKRGQVLFSSYALFFFLISRFFLNLESLANLELIFLYILFHSDFRSLFIKASTK